MKRYLFFLFIGLFACALPGGAIPAPLPTPTPTTIPSPNLAPQPTLPVGSDQNPLILALAPSSHPADDVVTDGKQLAIKLESLTGYHVVAVVPSSESDLLKALEASNAHIADLSPLAYQAAYDNSKVRAALASARNGEIFYGAQFITRAKDGYKIYYDPIKDENTADAALALSQFKDKKPCWSDSASPSGYVIPFGVLNQVKVRTRPGAFVEGQPTVVRAVYAGGICDFGATYIDARDHPSLEADYPDVKEQVDVVWHIPAIIPYDVIVFSSSLTPEAERSLLRAFVDIMGTPEGKAMIQRIYGIDELQIVQDALYKDFREYVNSSGLQSDELVK